MSTVPSSSSPHNNSVKFHKIGNENEMSAVFRAKMIRTACFRFQNDFRAGLNVGKREFEELDGFLGCLALDLLFRVKDEKEEIKFEEIEEPF